VEQAGALEPEYLPAVQWPHATSASAVSESARNLPASHSVHSTEPLPEYCPPGQLEHAADVEPVAAFTNSFPTEHVEHASLASPEYSPSPQSVHAFVSGPMAVTSLLPASQLEQSSSESTLNRPVAHSSQAMLSLEVAESTNFLPAVHAMQELAPVPL
jgi:hypothetical protein